MQLQEMRCNWPKCKDGGASKINERPYRLKHFQSVMRLWEWIRTADGPRFPATAHPSQLLHM